MFCLIFWKAKSDEILLLFFFISYVSMCYLKVEHKIFHIRVKKKAGHQRASSPHHKNVMFCDRVPLPVRAGRQRKKILSKQAKSNYFDFVVAVFF